MQNNAYVATISCYSFFFHSFVVVNRVEFCRLRFRSIRVHVRTTGSFSREVEGDIQHVPGHFTSHPQHVSRACEYDFEQLLNELKLAVHNFNARGSNFVLDAVTQFVVVITQFRPLGGSTYIPTPPSIAKKHAVINIQNEDNRCFEWSVLSCLYPAKSNPLSVYSYSKYRDALNFDGIDFPVQVK